MSFVTLLVSNTRKRFLHWWDHFSKPYQTRPDVTGRGYTRQKKTRQFQTNLLWPKFTKFKHLTKGSVGTKSVCDVFVYPSLPHSKVVTISNPSSALEAKSETLRKPQNVPAWTESWPAAHHWCLAPCDLAYLWKAVNRIRIIMGEFGCTQIQTSNSWSSKRKFFWQSVF